MKPNRRRDRSRSASPPYRSSPPSSGESGLDLYLLHAQVLQNVLRRTSLSEMRDREIVEWLTGAEKWLRECCSARPCNGEAGSGLHSGNGIPNQMNSSTLAELRLLLLGVLRTMPWWRVVEMDSSSDLPSSVSEEADGQRRHRTRAEGRQPVARSSARRAEAIRNAVFRWNVRMQIAFERVCLLLVEQSQHIVRHVVEVLMRPYSMRPPICDGARRSLPCDSLVRVLNSVATKYSSSYVVDLLESCMTELLPKQRWVERRHHVACTAVLLHLALEGHTPAFRPQLGNTQCLTQAIDLLKSLRRDATTNELTSLALPYATHSTPQMLPPTSEESGTDTSLSITSTSCRPAYCPSTGMLLAPGSQRHGSGSCGTLPAGYVSSAVWEGAVAGRGIQQPRLPRPDLSSALPATTSEAELSDTGTFSSAFQQSTSIAPGLTMAAGTAAAAVAEWRQSSSSAAVPPASAVEERPSADMSDVSVEHNNKMLSYRNDIIRILLNRLLDIEQALEPQDGEISAMAMTPGSSLRRCSSSFYAAMQRDRGGPQPSDSASSSLFSSPVSLQADRSLTAFPRSPAALAPTGLAGDHRMRSGTSSVSPAAMADLSAAAGAGANIFSEASQPSIRILHDCTTLVYGRLAEDLRRQQVAGSCGNAEWWRELLHFYLTAICRVERPVCLLYLAPSLAVLGSDDEAVDMMHKLISLVTKGYMPVQPSRSVALARQMTTAPMRLRMAPPTGGPKLISMEERMRAARHIYPLFRFLRSRLVLADEGIRKRLLKWVVQELRRLPAGRSAASPSSSFTGGLPRDNSMVLILFAQWAAISALLGVDLLPPGDGPGPSSASSTTTAASASVSAGNGPSTNAAMTAVEVLQPLLERYTLQGGQNGVDSDGEAVPCRADDGSASGTSYYRPEQRLDLRQMSYEGLLIPHLMDSCVWREVVR